MVSKLKYFGLVVSLLTVIFSFLFFARNQIVYNFLVTAGFILTLICFLFVVLGKASGKNKVVWFIVILIFIAIQQISEPHLIDASYKIYLAQHRESLNTVNEILERYPGTSILGDSVRSVIYSLTKSEQTKLLIEKRKLKVWIIERNDKGIYYGLWGFLDVRLGLTYWTSSSMPDERYRRVEGAWLR